MLRAWVLLGLVAAAPVRAEAQEPAAAAPERAEPEPAAGEPAAEPAPAPAPGGSPPAVVSEVRIHILPEDGHRTQPATVRSRLQVEAGNRLDRNRISDDIRRIYKMGFFDDIQVGIIESAEGVVLTYHVLERPVVGKMLFDGVDEEDSDIKRIIRRARAKVDRFYDPDLIKQVAQDLRAHFESQGHYLAEVDVRTRKLERNRIEVSFVVESHAKLTIRRVELLGNRSVPDDEVLPFLANQEGGLFSFLSNVGTYQRGMLFQRDVEVVRQVYASKGYAFARVGTPAVTLLPDREGIHIAIPVIEGEQYSVGAVDLSGDLLGTKEELMSMLKLETETTFDIRVLFEDVGKLSHHYRDQGYAFADVSYDMKADHERRVLGITYKVQKGAKVRIGRIEVTGNDRTHDDVIRRELKLTEGDYYSETKLELSRARVERTGYFDAVTVRKKVRTVEGGRQVLDLDVHVRRRQTGSFQVGVGFSSFESFIFNAQIAEQNFLGRGQSLGFNALISSLRTLFSISFHEPYFFDTDVAFGFNAFNLNELFVDFERERSGGSLTWGYHLTDDLTASFTYRLEMASARIGSAEGRASVPVAKATQKGLTSAVELRLSYDTRDNRIFPRKGQISTVAWERAEPKIGSDLEYDRWSFRTRWFFPFVLNTTLRLNGSYSFVTTDQPGGMPIFERFFAGGIFDIRGFTRHSLGPQIEVPASRDPGAALRGFVIGGTKKLVLNAEIEFPIFEAARISGVFFLDVGNAYGEDEYPALSLDSTRESVGFGVRWWSPVGPLRFEWGFPLDRLPHEDSMVFEFTIGSSF